MFLIITYALNFIFKYIKIILNVIINQTDFKMLLSIEYWKIQVIFFLNSDKDFYLYIFIEDI